MERGLGRGKPAGGSEGGPRRGRRVGRRREDGARKEKRTGRWTMADGPCPLLGLSPRPPPILRRPSHMETAAVGISPPSNHSPCRPVRPALTSPTSRRSSSSLASFSQTPPNLTPLQSNKYTSSSLTTPQLTFLSSSHLTSSSVLRLTRTALRADQY